MPPELFGMGVAGRHHRGSLGHATIGLPQFDAVSRRQAVEQQQPDHEAGLDPRPAVLAVERRDRAVIQS